MFLTVQTEEGTITARVDLKPHDTETATGRLWLSETLQQLVAEGRAIEQKEKDDAENAG